MLDWWQKAICENRELIILRCFHLLQEWRLLGRQKKKEVGTWGIEEG